jgi:hypothetical protein
MSQGTPSLPANRALVVQFRAPREGTPLRWKGRIERVVSGEVLRFESQEQLLAFMHRCLTGAESPPTAP